MLISEVQLSLGCVSLHPCAFACGSHVDVAFAAGAKAERQAAPEVCRTLHCTVKWLLLDRELFIESSLKAR